MGARNKHTQMWADPIVYQNKNGTGWGFGKGGGGGRWMGGWCEDGDRSDYQRVNAARRSGAPNLASRGLGRQILADTGTKGQDSQTVLSALVFGIWFARAASAALGSGSAFSTIAELAVARLASCARQDRVSLCRSRTAT